jgi:hypothetical protein
VRILFVILVWNHLSALGADNSEVEGAPSEFCGALVAGKANVQGTSAHTLPGNNLWSGTPRVPRLNFTNIRITPGVAPQRLLATGVTQVNFEDYREGHPPFTLEAQDMIEGKLTQNFDGRRFVVTAVDISTIWLREMENGVPGRAFWSWNPLVKPNTACIAAGKYYDARVLLANEEEIHQFSIVLPESLAEHQCARAATEIQTLLTLLPLSDFMAVRGFVVDLKQFGFDGHASPSGIISIHLSSEDIDRGDEVLSILGLRHHDVLHHEVGHVIGFSRFGKGGYPPDWETFMEADGNNIPGGPDTPIEDFARFRPANTFHSFNRLQSKTSSDSDDADDIGSLRKIR